VDPNRRVITGAYCITITTTLTSTTNNTVYNNTFLLKQNTTKNLDRDVERAFSWLGSWMELNDILTQMMPLKSLDLFQVENGK